MVRGDRVRRRGSDVVGVVIDVHPNGLVDVSFHDGISTIHRDELVALEPSPTDRLQQGDLGSLERFRLRLHALFLKHAYRYDAIAALSSARIEPELHQVFVAHRVVSKLAPRMILSDEVGLGKTIEAGLVLKELRARGLVRRVLACVPASLQLQWQRELASKFNERFEIIDGAAAKHLGRGGANPFKVPDNVICSHSFAIRPPRTDQIAESPWDLVIFDEAHRVRRSQQGGTARPTKLYELAEELKDQSFGMLLLTATPMQLSPFELWSSIELVEPGLYPSYHAYVRNARLLPLLNEAMRNVQHWGALPREERQAFVQSNAARTLRERTELSPQLTELDDPGRRAEVQRGLVEAHPLTQVLVRNRKANIGGFTRRIAQRIPVELSEAEQDAYEAVAEYLRNGYQMAVQSENRAVGFLMVTYQKMLASSSNAIRQSLKRRLARLKQLQSSIATAAANLSPNREADLREADSLTDAIDELENLVDPERLDWEIEQLYELIGALDQLRDSKAKGLLRLIRETLKHEPDAKLLVFTQFIETQRFLQAVMKANELEAVIFNGRMSLDEKEHAVEQFRDNAQVLISTESGGEGRNFQFAHILINYDLPWNPMKVEQRIGRLDRIGQRRDVLIYNLIAANTVEERVLELLEERIRLFEEAVGSLDPILGQVERDIERIVMTAHDLSAELADYGEKDLEQRLAEAREKEHALADFVLDEASLRRDEAQRLLANADPMARAEDLERFVSDVLDHYGGTLTKTEDEEAAITLSPGLAAKVRSSERVTIGVFDPRHALRLEHRPFLAFGHPLIDAVVELPINDDPVAAAVQRRRDVASPHVEIIYQLTTEGMINQGELIRHRVTDDLSVISERLLTAPQTGIVGESVPIAPWVSEAIAASREAMTQELDLRRADVAEKDAGAREARLEREKRVYDEAVRRLRAHIADQMRRIEQLEESGTERQRRIIPALKGQIDRTQDRLQELEASHGARLHDIERTESTSGFRVLTASLVLPL